MKERPDDFQTRREHLKDMSDEELKKYFFELTEKVVSPLVDLARTHTSKSIERSVLLRMGFSSIEAKSIVEELAEHNLLAFGAGHCVYRLSKEKAISIRDAGKSIAEGEHLQTLKGWFSK